MRSQVQVQPGPPTNPAGQSAAGNKPGALAASLGRAGAARPSPPARPSAPEGRSMRAAGATTTTDSGRPPIPRRAAAGDGRSARRPGLPGASVRRGRRPPPARPGSATDSPADPASPRRRRPYPGRLGRRPEPLDDPAAHRDLDPFRGTGCRAASACPQRHRLMGTRRTRPDGPGRTPAGRTPDGPDTRRPDGPGR